MRPHGRRAAVNAGNPEAFAQCDRCGFWYNRSGLQWQYQWGGTHIYSLGMLVCDICYDTPFEQLRTIILPPDPPPVINARPPNFTYEETGPVQAVLAASVPAGSNVLALQPASVPGLQDASAFTIGSYVWVQLITGTFTQAQVTGTDIVNNTLTLGVPLPVTAPSNGTVTVSSTQVGES